MDSQNRVQKVFVDKQTDLSKWMQGIPAVYTFDLCLKGVVPGNYYWAVGLVDTTRIIRLAWKWLCRKTY